jgi:hypothetical protein
VDRLHQRRAALEGPLVAERRHWSAMDRVAPNNQRFAAQPMLALGGGGRSPLSPAIYCLNQREGESH